MTKTRAIARYCLRAVGLIAGGIVVFVVTALALMDADGNTRRGVPDIAVVVPMALGCLLLLFGGLSLLNGLRMAFVLSRHSWISVDSSFREIGGLGTGGTPNGQPVVLLTSGDTAWNLTLAALRWRWRKFDRTDLRFAGEPGHAGVLATPDRRELVWGGRSIFTRLILAREGRKTRVGGADRYSGFR